MEEIGRYIFGEMDPEEERAFEQRMLEDAELRRLMNKLGDISDHQREEIEAAFHRLTNKLMHPPLESLREESEGSGNDRLFDAIRQLFKLDQ